ncbi:MAG: bifunctional phosphoribosyl-AMP cyclohydrolase/phosphoribosyl-ATP diphosphatase HisIE [Deltaproteobacteria bacterium]|nr:bifunctional phosphoribosyl-AMP cyclohydrolase/phosphoribosyl-ATP diphosphatase HisIE [Deltaproteobacteria bacterium]
MENVPPPSDASPPDRSGRDDGNRGASPALAWDDRGLVPAVAQDAITGAVLMVAWMNREALELTVATREAHFFSRSRGALWRKGETSGHTLSVREIRTDCDSDTVLLLVDPAGPTCHTGKTSCFYRKVQQGEAQDDGPPGVASSVLERVYRLILMRKSSTAAASYTKSLLDGGFPKILSKIAEEQEELAAELPTGEPKAIVHEATDLVFHVLVGLAARDIALADVFAELARRLGTSGHVEKASRPPKLP